jgi:hypothetical protein
METENQSVRAAFAAEFPPELLKSLSKGGTKLTYLPVSECIVRLNNVLGVGNWSTEIMKIGRDELDPGWVVAHVRLYGEINGKHFSHEHFGGQKIKRTTKDDQVVDLGDEFKGAVSDALKKAAQNLEIGLYLARSADALDYELQESRCTIAQITSLKELVGKLTDVGKKEFKDWWVEKGMKGKLDELARYDYDEVFEELTRRVENDPGRPFEEAK